MSKNEKIKLGLAIGAFVIAGGLVYWQFSGSGEHLSKIDPERMGPVVEPPTNAKGQPEPVFGNRRVPPK